MDVYFLLFHVFPSSTRDTDAAGVEERHSVCERGMTGGGGVEETSSDCIHTHTFSVCTGACGRSLSSQDRESAVFHVFPEQRTQPNRARR